MKEKFYEVYICKYDGKVVYVGEGAYNRHKHCTSGCSHVYGLNELYFKEELSLFDVKVFHVETKEQAVQLEKKYIEEYRPKFNKVGLTNERGEKGQLCAEFKKSLLINIKKSKPSPNQFLKLKICIDEFLTYHTHDLLNQEGLKLRGHCRYRTVGLTQLASVVGNMKQGKMSEKSIPYKFKMALEEAYCEHYGNKCSIEFV